jgi:hypothetical protein
LAEPVVSNVIVDLKSLKPDIPVVNEDERHRLLETGSLLEMNRSKVSRP